MSDYEARRAKNLEDNKRILRELGLLNPFLPLPKVHHHPRPRQVAQTQKRKHESERTPITASKAFKVDDSHGSILSPGQRRRSSRLRGEAAAEGKEIDSQVERELEEEDDEGRPRIKIPPNRPNIIGAVPGVEVGTWWATRSECSAAAIHRPWVAGIHGGEDGCYSLALSGGYEDDIDMGECFTYTGEGGRDLKGTKNNPKNLRTAAQSKDQSLTRGNYALTRSVETGNPVRVIRGYKLHGPFAPDEGYRYDGLYKVEKYWFTIGLSGFGVYKFALKRIADQAPPPWDVADSGVGSEIGSECPLDNLSDAGSDIKSETQQEESSKAYDDTTFEEKVDVKSEPTTTPTHEVNNSKLTVECRPKEPGALAIENKSEIKVEPVNLTDDEKEPVAQLMSIAKEEKSPEKCEGEEVPKTASNTSVEKEMKIKAEPIKKEAKTEDPEFVSPTSMKSPTNKGPRKSKKSLTPKGVKDIRSFFGKSPAKSTGDTPER